MPLRYDKLNPNVARSKGEGKARYAPHKPLLLLSIIDLAEAGVLNPPMLFKTAALRLRFESFWSVCQPRWGGMPGLDLPFHYLSSQGFWTCLTKEGTPSLGPHSTHAVQLSEGFIADCSDANERDRIRRLLVRSWFPEREQRALFAALGFSNAKLSRFEWEEQVAEDLVDIGRDANFRVSVVSQYHFTCALTGYGMHTSKGHALVEAAHIHSFSKSRNNSPKNGLALSRDAHWMFDKGLWTITPSHRVSVASEVFTEWGSEANWLKSRQDQPLVFHGSSRLRPDERHLSWHRENVFEHA